MVVDQYNASATHHTLIAPLVAWSDNAPQSQKSTKQKHMWNKEKYEQFKSAVESNLKHLTFVSTGACPGCRECELSPEASEHEIEQANEPCFSWLRCESCGSRLGGDRHPTHGRDSKNEIVHLEVCSDCLYFLNYGELDDQSMIEIEQTATPQ